MSANNCLSVTQASNSTDQIPYVPAEQVLGLATPKQKSPLSKLSVPLLNLALSFLPIEDLPAFAGTSTANQSLAVNTCFKRMKETWNGQNFEEALPRAITCCRGKRKRFRATEILNVEGVFQVTALENASRFLGDAAQNTQLAQKLCNTNFMQFCVTCPDLTPFATHCAKLTNLWLESVPITGEEPLPAKFLNVHTLAVWSCPQLTRKGLSNLLFQCPRIQQVEIVNCPLISRHFSDLMHELSDNKELNNEFHG